MGRPEFETIVASAARESLNSVDLSVDGATTPIAAGATENIDLFSSSGTIGHIQSAYLNALAPIGATTGTHLLNITSGSQRGGFTQGTSNFGSDILFNQKSWILADNAKLPSSDSAQVAAFNDNVFDSAISLRFVYTNNTDAVQTGFRIYRMTYVEKVIGS